jgi:hypothetical protein
MLKRNDEVAVGERLHQRARTEAVRAVIGEVRPADREQAATRLARGFSGRFLLIRLPAIE